ncbi:MAG: LacI family DNA-binding transcriptional regulator [Devosiaceae bacterium]|nr:LacI family DNA-binding transcriptional regulator [Devosiaceae bacterium]
MQKKIRARRAPTETDVAKLAGVSQSAVSRAFTPGASVAKATREKILKAAQKIGYQTNLMARSLATSRSNIVALAISNLENPFYAQVVKELSERLRDTGRHILLFTTKIDGTADPELERVLSYQVDALILTATTASIELTDQCQKNGIPIVQINRESKISGISTVRGENQKAAEQIAQFLIAGGHKNFAFIGGTKDSNTSQIRQHAFASHLKSLGFPQVQIAFGDYSFEGAAAATRQILNSKKPVDAIFCASDYMAFAALDVVRREFGLKVPQDISIVGVDDVPEASHSAYDLTTYSQPAASLAEEAIKIIDQQIAHPGRRAMRREVRGELILRGSARLPDNSIFTIDGKKVWRS